jgi:hypothetical protein
MMIRSTYLASAALVAAAVAPAWAQPGTMNMPAGHMNIPMTAERQANFAPTRQAYTTNHQLLVRLLSLPRPIPFEKYFALRLAVYDPQYPARPLPDAKLELSTGMRHGLKHGFAHGMQSSPRIAGKDGVFTVSGMYFHMMGPWILKTTVADGGKEGTAYFRLPCCGS